MWTATLVADLLLGDVHSLKEKRSVVRPIVAELQRSGSVAAAEVGHLDLHRRAEVGAAAVSADRSQCVTLLDRCERLLEGHPEVEILSVRRVMRSDEDDGWAVAGTGQ